MRGPRLTWIIGTDADRPIGCAASVISVTVYISPNRHGDLGAVRAAIAAALERPFAGVAAIHLTVQPVTGAADPHPCPVGQQRDRAAGSR